VDNAENDGHLHIVRVREDELVVRAVPARVQAEVVGVSIWSHGYSHSAVFESGKVPSRVPEVKRLGEDVVVDQTGVHREQAHEKDNVTTAKEMWSERVC
jgi:hypothetical protein